MNTEFAGHSKIREMIEAYGGLPVRWPNPYIADELEQALRIDDNLRLDLDQAGKLDRSLMALRDDTDSSVVLSGSVDRVRSHVLRHVRPRLFGRLQWAAAISMIVCGAGLGGLSDLKMVSPAGTQEIAMAVDPIVFDAIEGDLR